MGMRIVEKDGKLTLQKVARLPLAKNKAQRDELRRIASIRFNKMNGKLIAKDLKHLEGCWYSAIIGQFTQLPLLALREIQYGQVVGDTLILKIPKANWKAFATSSKGRWQADTITDLSKKAMELCGERLGKGEMLIAFWWD